MQVTTTRMPIGVIAAIIPWNSQMLLTAVKLAPALAMGNTVVIKASELAPVLKNSLFESNGLSTLIASSDDKLTNGELITS